MALLAELATRIPALRKETTGTEALGLILRHPEAASALSAAVRLGASSLPNPLKFTTQVANADGRPDVVGHSDDREVLLVEGKFWFGFTPGQADGAYLRRLEDEWRRKAPTHPHVGALVFVVPPRRVLEVADKVRLFYSLTDQHAIGEWRFAKAPNGIIVGVCSWQQLLSSLTATANEAVAADCRQLKALVDAIDEAAFMPWSVEQLTDQETPKRIYQLVSLVTTVRDQAIREGVATHLGSRQTSKFGSLTYSKNLTLGGVPATLAVTPYLWASHGQSPIWLRFRTGKALVEQAFGNDCRHTDTGVAIPVPIAVDVLEDEVVVQMLDWLRQTSARLEAARKAASISTLVDTLVEGTQAR